MNKFLIFLSAMSVVYCASPVDVQTRSSETEDSDDVVTANDSSKVSDSLALILSELSSDINIDSLKKIYEELGMDYTNDSTFIDNGFVGDDQEKSDNDDTNDQYDDLIKDYLDNDEIDSSAIQNILESLEIEEVDSSNIKSVIDAVLMESSDQAFETESISVTGMTQVMTLNEETIALLFGEEVDVPEGFTYDLPVILAVSGDSPVVYVPVGEGSDINAGQLVTIVGREQIDSGENQSGFKFLLIE